MNNLFKCLSSFWFYMALFSLINLVGQYIVNNDLTIHILFLAGFTHLFLSEL